ncbi:MAG: ABC transporter permease [Tissierellia bacterium]|nr:ABC transporter permease [Tissierellia bacterium]
MISIKNVVNDRVALFWTILFPMLLTLVFHFAFGDMEEERIKIPIAIEENEELKRNFQSMKIFDIQDLAKEKAEEALENDDILGIVNGDKIIIKSNGLEQNILYHAVNTYGKIRGSALPIEDFEFERPFIKAEDNKIQDFDLVFYTLIVMLSLYSAFFINDFSNVIQPNRSVLGQRISISPAKKSELILYSSFTYLALNTVATLILMGFLQFVLKREIFVMDYRNLLLVLCGSFYGIALGMAISVIPKISSSVQTGLTVFAILFFTALSGMQNADLKILADEKLPWLQSINPANILTENYYRINQLQIFDGFFQSIVKNILTAIVLMIVPIIVLRRSKYESI